MKVVRALVVPVQALGWSVGKSADIISGVMSSRFWRSYQKHFQEKPLGSLMGVRTKTDTGWRDEYSKALERTLVKELGKLTA